MFRSSSASVPAKDLNGNPVIFQKVEMNPNQQWMPIGTSLSNIKHMLAVSEESSASCSAVDALSPIHCPVTTGLDISECKRNVIPFRKALLFETSNMIESNSKQDTIYFSHQVPSSEANDAIRYLQTATELEVKASNETILYTDPLPPFTEDAASINISKISNFNEGPIFQLNLPDNNKMKTYICDTQLSMVRPASSKPVTTIYDITIPLNNTADDDSTVIDSITKFTSQLTTSCHTAIQAIDPIVVYEMASGEPALHHSVTRDLPSQPTNSSHKTVDPAMTHRMDYDEPAFSGVVTSDTTSHLTTTCHRDVHAIDPVIKCRSTSGEPASYDHVTTGWTTTRDVICSGQSQVNATVTEPCLVTDDNYEWWVDTWLEQIRIAVCANSPEGSAMDTDVIPRVTNVQTDEFNVAAVKGNSSEVIKQDSDVPTVQVVDGHLVNINLKRLDIQLGTPQHSTTMTAVVDVKPERSAEHSKTCFDTLDDQRFVNQWSTKQQRCHAGVCSLNGSALFLSNHNKAPEINGCRHKQQQGHVGMSAFNSSGLLLSENKKTKTTRCRRKRNIEEMFVNEQSALSKIHKSDI